MIEKIAYVNKNLFPLKHGKIKIGEVRQNCIKDISIHNCCTINIIFSDRIADSLQQTTPLTLLIFKDWLHPRNYFPCSK